MTPNDHEHAHDDVDAILGVTASPQAEARAKPKPIPLEGDPSLRRTPTRRVFFNSLRSEAAADALRGLPATGETWHHIMTGAYDGFDLVDAILDHAGGPSIATLYLATLGFNEANTTRLLNLMDAKRIGTCRMLVSMFYEADHKEAAVCYRLAHELPARGGWYHATRTHAKIIAAHLSDGRAFVVESSANLRSCRAIEQFTITQDTDLYQFHRTWMESVHERETT